MLKKIILGLVFAVFIGALVTGAVIRTMDKSEQTKVAEETDGGRGRNASLENIEISESQGNGQGRGRLVVEGDEFVAQGQGRGGNGGEGSDRSVGEESDHLWDAYIGAVTEVSEELVIIEAGEGEEILIEGKAWMYAQEQGYELHVDDMVQLEGFFEDGEFKVSSIENKTTGESILLRDASGRPSWAGGKGGNL